MPTRIGELLIKEGLITAAELDEALNSQVIFGGKLGTNLIEMGCVTEGEVASALGKATGLPFVNPDQLKAIPNEIVAIIPAHMAEKHQILPVALNGRRLSVAMTDPSDLPAIDEISFTTGFIIIPMIASELTVTRNLEKYYGIKRKVRTHRIKGGTRQRDRQQSAAPNPFETPVKVAHGQPTINFDVPDFPPLEEFKGFHLSDEPETPPATAPAPQPVAQPQQAAPPQPRPQPQPVAPPQPVSQPQPAAPPQPVATPQAAPVPPAQAPTDAPSVTADSLTASLAEVRDRDSVAELLLMYAAQQFPRSAVFIMRGEFAYGWKRIEKDGRAMDCGDVSINLEEPSVLNQVARARNFYLGPIPDLPENRKMIAGLGGKQPEMAVLIPLIVAKRIVAIFYVEGPLVLLTEQLVDLQKWANKATMALEILILKNKIMMT